MTDMPTPKATQAVEVTGEPREDHELAAYPRGLVGAIMDVLWPILGGSHTAASVWTEINDGVSEAITAWNRRPSPVAESTPAAPANTGRAEVLEEAEVERVAQAINGVKGGLNYDYMDFCRDAARAAIRALSPLPPEQGVGEGGAMCEDCPPVGYPTDETRCLPCPRRGAPQ